MEPVELRRPSSRGAAEWVVVRCGTQLILQNTVGDLIFLVGNGCTILSTVSCDVCDGG
jgi:hypothetical protein